MEMIQVESSTIVAIGYDKESRRLRVQFKKSIYDYYDVPEYVHYEMMQSGSKGDYLNVVIKGNYNYKKVSG